jgi:hypothetical protein
MEPVTTAAVGLLVGYLGRLGVKVGEQVAGELDEAVLGRLRRLYELVKARVAGDGYAAGALERVEAEPENERRQGALEDALGELVDADGEFAAQLGALVEEVKAASGGMVQVSDAGVVSFGGQVTMRGRYVAGRDMTVGESPPDGER